MTLRRARARVIVRPSTSGDVITIDGGGSTGLRIVYDVARTADRQPNAGSLMIYNLAEATRKRIAGAIPSDRLRIVPPSDSSPFKSDALLVELPSVIAERYGYAYVELEAGYDNGLARIHEGASSRVRSRRAGVTWETSLTFGDGAAPLAHANAGETFDRGTSVWEVVRHLAKATGLVSGNINRKTWESMDTFGGGFMGDQYLGASFVAAGDPLDLLAQLVSIYGIRVFVDQGEIWMIGRTGYLADPIVDLGVPRAEPEDTEDGILVEVDHNPLLRPGVRARVSSYRTSDVWFVDAVRFAGDTDSSLACLVDLVPIAAGLGGA